MEFKCSSLPARFWDKVEVSPSGCWLWTACLSVHGYGMFRLDGKSRQTHHITKGQPPEGLVTDHLCRVRSCCNPQHLEFVSLQENIMRGEAPAAVNARKTHCKDGHPLSGDNLQYQKDGRRRCRTCTKAYLKKYDSNRRGRRRERSRAA